MRKYTKNRLIYVFICLFAILVSICSCRSPKIIEREVIRDSIVFVPETICVELPKEIIKEVVPMMDTLHMETSIAEASAYVDTTTKTLQGTISNKDVPIQTVIHNKIEYHDRDIVKTQVVTKYVIKYKKHVPKFIKWMLIVLIAYLLYSQRKNLLKLIKLLRKLILRV